MTRDIENLFRLLIINKEKIVKNPDFDIKKLKKQNDKFILII